jgi:heptosyltransferase III
MVVALKAQYPAVSVSFLVRTYTRDLVAYDPGIHRVLTSDAGGAAKSFWSLVRELRQARFDAAVVASPTLRTALLVRCAGIPIRVGTGYRWYSALFNRRVYEHRKTAAKHEAEFNVSLLSALGVQTSAPVRAVLTVPDSARQAAERIRRSKGFGPADQVVVLHPGSGGSARDWRAENFGRLARKLSEAGARVIVTGGRGEEALVARACKASGLTLATSVGEMDLLTLAAFLSSASLFVSNSTGPLHIAAAVGIPVIGFYPPIIQCSPRRWGPLAERKVIFEADATHCVRCKGGPCQGDDCMEMISVEDVAEAARGLLQPMHTARKEGQAR